MPPEHITPVALTIAGSDSGGGAGIQTDLKTFAAHKVYGTTAITCVTAQNPDTVIGVEAISPEMVVRQINAVCDGFDIAAAKTGMLYSADIIYAVADAVRRRQIRQLVVDPVMVATSGATLLQDDAIATLQEALLPRALLVTPNIPEAEILWGQPIRSAEEQQDAAEGIAMRFGIACVVKGGHMTEDEGSAPQQRPHIVNVLYAGGQLHSFQHDRVAGGDTHGTGCTFAAAVTASLAKELPLERAVEAAGAFVGRAIAHALDTGKHRPLGLFHHTSA
ncbi:MAG: bifunctional hydroxymethylpyrimidine kinase/phosphomethylpyrimidine kinase [Verrucomicrobia bacterium]|jgi:hydroxymethylpyrimidine/phosphomethylpyrimidine kinase|nr:bifunctional hydroxymethylpyrimidine kinase/phosphomethylpyrimidine kinase [Verrucomicrobiota bacterium]MBT7065739.1 bifunctional hydroxymethylpyrimidine kinase/phosphomethylpyrimidine kinase [Verrucomicrobiota bacterium]MBT7699478.1 bifunctional hydroxymethylpyrimidine kinase/phosphomethylpyrimidine kinase [Verrucomicrobiota bacterium]